MFKTCEEYVLSELTRLQLENERLTERNGKLEEQNAHLMKRVVGLEPEVHRLTKENFVLMDELREIARENMLDRFDEHDDPDYEGGEIC